MPEFSSKEKLLVALVSFVLGAVILGVVYALKNILHPKVTYLGRRARRV